MSTATSHLCRGDGGGPRAHRVALDGINVGCALEARATFDLLERNVYDTLTAFAHFLLLVRQPTGQRSSPRTRTRLDACKNVRA